LLTIEFWLYAMRLASTKARFARRFSIVRERLAEQIARRHSRHGVESRWSPDESAPLVFALDARLFIQHLAEPDGIGPQLRAKAIIELVDPEIP